MQQVTVTATTNHDEFLVEARHCQQTGQYHQAEIICRKILDVDADNLAARVLLALSLNQQEKSQEASEVIGDTYPQTSDTKIASDLGLLAIMHNELQQAMTYLEQACDGEQTDYVALARLGTLYMMMGDFPHAEQTLSKARELAPEHPAILSNLAGVFLRQDKLEDALQTYEQALRVAPDLETAEQGRTSILVLQDRSAEILDEITAKLDKQPDSIELRQKKLHILLLEERFEEARDILRELILFSPHTLSYPLQLLNLYAREEQYPLVLKELVKFERDFPDQPELLNVKARAYKEIMRLDPAMETIEHALTIEPDSVHSLVTRAMILADQELYDDAESDLRKALDTHPGLAEGWSLLGHILLWKGRLDEAVEVLKRAASINPSALSSLAEARAIPDDPAVLDCMQRFAALRLVPSEARAAMNFALNKLFEKTGDYKQAFEFAQQANQLTRATISHIPERHQQFTSKIIETFTPELFKKFEGLGSYSERPVFVVGMPRSGTTLTEQILASHPEVYGAGELGVINAITRLMPVVLNTQTRYPECMSQASGRTFDHAARYYLKALRKRDIESKRVVDKLPHNFMHLGLISIIFPYAKIIHVKRDLRDIAISNYFTNFKMKRSGMSYAFDLGEIGHMLNDYVRVMDHWHKVLPIPIHEYNYEDLVAEPEKMEKQLIDYVELDWTPEIMDFYHTERAVRTASVWQVRQPIYKSSRERWRHYKEFLEPLNAVIEKLPT